MVSSLKIVAKVLKLKQKKESDQALTISGYYVEEEKWNMHDVEVDPSSIVNKLLEVAAEYTTRERKEDTFTLTEVETTGMRVAIGESTNISSSTIIVPKPTYLRRIVFYKCNEHGNCSPVYEYRPKSQLIVYEGDLGVSGIDYDFAVVECSDITRVIFPHELIQSRVKSTEDGKKRKRRRKTRSTKKKATKKKSKKKKKKASKRRSRKKARKSKR